MWAGLAKAADEKPKKPEFVAMNPEDGGTEYKIQGEYEGSAGSAKVGAQVIARGDGNFFAVFEPGGLPGSGWDGKTKLESSGKLEGDVVAFTPDAEPRCLKPERGHEKDVQFLTVKPGYSASINAAGEELAGKTDGGESFTLKKVLRHSPTEGEAAPTGAIILFDGKSADAWAFMSKVEESKKINEKGWLLCGCKSKEVFQDYTLHVEFYLPFKPFATSQGRANSGVYQQDRYEVQVLDSFGLAGQSNECAGIYTVAAPLVNMCYPPLTWQTYDIDFTAARYDAQGKKVSNAFITLKHNGVLVQDHTEVKDHTGGGQKEDPSKQIQEGPIQLQPHGNPVYYKNVWIVKH